MFSAKNVELHLIQTAHPVNVSTGIYYHIACMLQVFDNQTCVVTARCQALELHTLNTPCGHSGQLVTIPRGALQICRRASVWQLDTVSRGALQIPRRASVWPFPYPCGEHSCHHVHV